MQHTRSSGNCQRVARQAAARAWSQPKLAAFVKDFRRRGKVVIYEETPRVIASGQPDK